MLYKKKKSFTFNFNRAVYKYAYETVRELEKEY